jgi:hypothetical protein
MMRARWQLTAAARELAPLRQGELDGLCGLYAIINAVRLARYPARLRKPELDALFAEGLRVLSATRRLRYILADGMYDHVWTNMTAAVLARAAGRPGQSLALEDLLTSSRVRSMKSAHRVIRHALHGGAPTLVLLTRSYDHWSVISGYTKSRYYLFDSSGYRWISAANVVLDSSERDAPHGLARALALRPG